VNDDQLPPRTPGSTEHYFSDRPRGPEQRRTITARLFGRDVDLVTANGVFSGDGLDLGTAVLLRESPIPTGKRRICDLGCGYGPVAVGLALAAPEVRIDAVDVNERALALCADNAVRHGVADRIRVLSPAEVGDEERYDEIWSNPPIRIGKSALHDLLTTWLRRLTPDGVARLVVSRNLGADSLQQWLRSVGWSCTRVGSAKGFRVLEISRSED
jgi:16S rRNA (guanine1207-N2)-methyltransferase